MVDASDGRDDRVVTPVARRDVDEGETTCGANEGGGLQALKDNELPFAINLLDSGRIHECFANRHGRRNQPV